MTWMRRQLNSDEGFTLIELMVVVLIIAILIAIAIPTFLGARERAQDRAAQSNLRNALTAAKVFYVDEEDYEETDAAGTEAAYELIEPALNFIQAGNATSADANNDVHFIVENNGAGAVDQMVTFYVYSASGTTFGIKDVSANGTVNAGTYYCSGVVATFVGAGCLLASW